MIGSPKVNQHYWKSNTEYLAYLAVVIGPYCHFKLNNDIILGITKEHSIRERIHCLFLEKKLEISTV